MRSASERAVPRAADRHPAVVAAAIILVGLGAVALLIGNSRGDAFVRPDGVLAMLSVTVGTGLLAAPRAVLSLAIAWCVVAFALPALQLTPPFEPRIGDYALYPVTQLVGPHLNGTAGFLYSAAIPGIALALLLWAWSDPSRSRSPHAEPNPRLVRAAGLVLAITAFLSLPGVFFVMIFALSFVDDPWLAVVPVGSVLITTAVAVSLILERRIAGGFAWSSLAFLAAAATAVRATVDVPGAGLVAIGTAAITGRVFGGLLSRSHSDPLGNIGATALSWAAASLYLLVAGLILLARVSRQPAATLHSS